MRSLGEVIDLFRGEFDPMLGKLSVHDVTLDVAPFITCTVSLSALPSSSLLPIKTPPGSRVRATFQTSLP